MQNIGGPSALTLSPTAGVPLQTVRARSSSRDSERSIVIHSAGMATADSNGWSARAIDAAAGAS